MADLRLRRTAGGLVPALVLLALALMPARAAGNPIPTDPLPFGDIHLENAADIVLFLSLNFITNLFLFSAIFLVLGMIWRRDVGQLDTDRNQYVLKLLGAVFIITLVGSLIDIAMLYVSSQYDRTMLYLKFDALRWGAALVMIFISIYLAARWILKIRRRVSVLICAGMTIANLAFWFSLLGSFRNPGLLPLLLLFVTPLLLNQIRRWHLKVYSAPKDHQPEPAPGEPAPEEQAPTEGGPMTGSEPTQAPDDIQKAVDLLES